LAGEPPSSSGPPGNPAEGDPPARGPAIREALSNVLGDLYIYGYLAARYEKTFAEPAVEEGRIVTTDAPAEWSTPAFHLMLQQHIGSRFKAFVNISGDGGGALEVRNLWGEYSPVEAFSLRMGKIYRQFGLYNEILDAVPTYIGIEPPELFDADHLILSRTTSFMILGRFDTGPGTLSYSLSTDNGEGDPALGTFPAGGDLRYRFGGDRFVAGISGYTSGGSTTPDKGLGEGSPKSGVLPWMAEDSFRIVGGFAEAAVGNLTLQAEYWRSPHEAVRDPALVVEMIEQADPSPGQRARFLIDPRRPVTEDNVQRRADYDVETWYLRGGYTIATRLGHLVPYFQWDWYSNPETIAKKTWGGDNEAGVTDDGEFDKGTLGLVYRPVSEVSIKLDASSHRYQLNGQSVHYEEVRFDVSYVFGRF
jgi:hypothetical protein